MKMKMEVEENLEKENKDKVNIRKDNECEREKKANYEKENEKKKEEILKKMKESNQKSMIDNKLCEREKEQEFSPPVLESSLSSSSSSILSSSSSSVYIKGWNCLCGEHVTVDVQSRTWPGINQPGGIGRIMKYDVQKDSYSVKYILGGSEKNIERKFIRCVTSLVSEKREVKSTATQNRISAENSNTKGIEKKKEIEKEVEKEIEKVGERERERGREVKLSMPTSSTSSSTKVEGKYSTANPSILLKIKPDIKIKGGKEGTGYEKKWNNKDEGKDKDNKNMKEEDKKKKEKEMPRQQHKKTKKIENRSASSASDNKVNAKVGKDFLLKKENEKEKQKEKQKQKEKGKKEIDSKRKTSGTSNFNSNNNKVRVLEHSHISSSKRTESGKDKHKDKDKNKDKDKIIGKEKGKNIATNTKNSSTLQNKVKKLITSYSGPSLGLGSDSGSGATNEGQSHTNANDKSTNHKKTKSINDHIKKNSSNAHEKRNPTNSNKSSSNSNSRSGTNLSEKQGKKAGRSLGLELVKNLTVKIDNNNHNCNNIDNNNNPNNNNKIIKGKTKSFHDNAPSSSAASTSASASASASSSCQLPCLPKERMKVTPARDIASAMIEEDTENQQSYSNNNTNKIRKNSTSFPKTPIGNSKGNKNKIPYPKKEQAIVTNSAYYRSSIVITPATSSFKTSSSSSSSSGIPLNEYGNSIHNRSTICSESPTARVWRQAMTEKLKEYILTEYQMMGSDTFLLENLHRKLTSSTAWGKSMTLLQLNKLLDSLEENNRIMKMSSGEYVLI